MNDLPQAAGEICAIFERMGCQYAIMGGLATRMHGIPRATYDIDFTVAVDRARLPEFYAIVEEKGYTVPEPFLRGWIDEVGGLPLVKIRLYLKDKNIDVDVFLAECEFQKELLARRRWESTQDVTGWFVSPEDLILLKLMANRRRDLSDVHDVLFMQGQLDAGYMRKWAGRLGVLDELNKHLAEAGYL